MTKNETETRKKRGTSSAIARCHDEVKLGATESGASAKPRGSGRGRPPALHPTEDEAHERADRSLRGRRLPIPDEASERPREPSAVSDADRVRTEPSPTPGRFEDVAGTFVRRSPRRRQSVARPRSRLVRKSHSHGSSQLTPFRSHVGFAERSPSRLRAPPSESRSAFPPLPAGPAARRCRHRAAAAAV